MSATGDGKKDADAPAAGRSGPALTRRTLLAGAGVMAAGASPSWLGSCATPDPQPWSDGTYWSDGTGWIDDRGWL
jgi:hypothetical protein